MDVIKINVDTDEDGYHLIIETSRSKFNFSLDDARAEDLYESAWSEIRPWLTERDLAKRLRPILDAETERMANDWVNRADPYKITDPKHPDHHSVMTEIFDSREGK